MSLIAPIETAELMAFVQTVDARSLSRAAAELGVPRATIGRRLARLEQRLGARLLRRTTRSLALTEAGTTFYRHARQVLGSLAQAEASVKTDEHVMRGDVRVSVPMIMSSSFSEMVTTFARRYPEVRVQLELTTRVVDLRREGYDVALRASAEVEPGLIARVVARQRLIAVASPEYLAVAGTPRSLKDLRRHRCLTGFSRGELPQSEWRIRGKVTRVASSFSSNDVFMLRAAALAGLGLALLPDPLLHDALAKGTLVQVLPKVLVTENQLAVVYVERALQPPHVRAFVDALVAWAPTLDKPMP